MKRYQFHILFRPEPEGGYTAIVPSLPGCVTYGKTIEIAQKMAEEAIEAYLESVALERESVHDDRRSFILTQEISYA